MFKEKVMSNREPGCKSLSQNTLFNWPRQRWFLLDLYNVLERHGQRKCSTIFLERMREGHCQSDEHWNRFKGNIGETSARRGGAHMGFSACIDTILNWTELRPLWALFSPDNGWVVAVKGLSSRDKICTAAHRKPAQVCQDLNLTSAQNQSTWPKFSVTQMSQKFQHKYTHTIYM